MINGVEQSFISGYPLILNSGELLSSSNLSGDLGGFNGFLVDENTDVTPITYVSTGVTSSYYVRDNKKLFVLGWSGSGDPILNGVTTNFSVPLILDAGQSLTNNQNNDIFRFSDRFMISHKKTIGQYFLKIVKISNHFWRVKWNLIKVKNTKN